MFISRLLERNEYHTSRLIILFAKVDGARQKGHERNSTLLGILCFEYGHYNVLVHASWCLAWVVIPN
jgi:hypothetical protein